MVKPHLCLERSCSGRGLRARPALGSLEQPRACPGVEPAAGGGNCSGCWLHRASVLTLYISGVGPSSGTTAAWCGFRPPKIFLGKEQAESRLKFSLDALKSAFPFSLYLLDLFIRPFSCWVRPVWLERAGALPAAWPVFPSALS